MLGRIATLGADFVDLWDDLAYWSQATFGNDNDRGPLGALRHLEKECREAQADPTDRVEYADCFILILDAARRAGIKPLDLIHEAQAKLKVNMAREWPKPVDADTPVEHIREGRP